VETELERLEKENHKVGKLSIVGYSLGGLIARYCIGLLYSRGWFERLQPVNFTAFASPFVGVRTPYRGYHSNFWNALGSRTLSASGQQLFVIDNFRDTGRPLLSIMTDPNSIFIRALSQFKNRVLYANIINDRSTPYFTAFISSSDPYEDLEAIKLNPLPDYQGTILDPIKSATLRKPEEANERESWITTGSSYLTRIPTYALIGVLVPIAAVGFLANATYQNARSLQRMKIHNEDKSDLGFSAYRISPFIEDTVEDITGSAPQQKLTDTTNTNSNEATKEQLEAAEKTKAGGEKDDLGFPTLARIPEQFELIKNLNAVGWRKYPVHITKVRHSHAAIIVRIDRNGYQEGNQVIRHWVDEEFEV
jgi:hypothetical protein